MKAVVLAAGRGIRLKPITDEIPKCMAEIKGKPMLEQIFERLIKAGIKEIDLIVGYKKDVIEEYFGAEFNGVPLNYFVQKEPKGTAHAISLVENYIDSDFLITNGDVIVETENYKTLMKKDEFDSFNGLILARKVQNPWRYGVLKIEGKKIVDLIEKPKPGEEPSNLVNAGVYKLSKDFFEAIKKTTISERNEYELVDSIKNYLKEGKKIEYRLCKGPCIDIATKEDLIRTDELLDSVFPK